MRSIFRRSPARPGLASLPCERHILRAVSPQCLFCLACWSAGLLACWLTSPALACCWHGNLAGRANLDVRSETECHDTRTGKAPATRLFHCQSRETVRQNCFTAGGQVDSASEHRPTNKEDKSRQLPDCIAMQTNARPLRPESRAFRSDQTIAASSSYPVVRFLCARFVILSPSSATSRDPDACFPSLSQRLPGRVSGVHP